MLRSLILILLCCAPLHAEPITAIAWNVESGGSDPAVIAKQLGELPKADIYALQEVSAQDAESYAAAIRKAHNNSYNHFVSWTGRDNRLFISYDDDRLELYRWSELFRHGDHVMNDWKHRCPLVCLFQDVETGRQFFFVNVHLARDNPKLRETQAQGLKEWPAKINLPIIAVGGFNFDYKLKTEEGNKSFQIFTAGNVWKWAKPQKLIDTNWADSDGDSRDDYPGSTIDLVFYKDLPSGWTITSEVIVRDGDFPDDDKTSDHRPVLVKFGE